MATIKSLNAVRHERRDTRQRFEQWARNPSCTANAISAIHGVSMAEVVRREGGQPTMGQSPFAIARGQTFERALFRDQAASLTEALTNAGVLPTSPVGFRDFRLRLIGGPMRALDDGLAATREFLLEVAGSNPRMRGRLPIIAAGPVVRIPGEMMLPEAILIIDVLVVTRGPEGRPVLTVGEIKTYPDRGGYTDGAELATARAQAGVYVHGLELVLEELGLHGQLEISGAGFLVLSKPGFSRPSVRANEDLRYQANRARRGFEQLRELARQHGSSADNETLVAAILSAPVEYSESCVAFCDRVKQCRDAALRAGDAAVLGEDVGRFLGPVGLHRALELLAGASAKTPAETDLTRRMAEADRRLPA